MPEGTSSPSLSSPSDLDLYDCMGVHGNRVLMQRILMGVHVSSVSMTQSMTVESLLADISYKDGVFKKIGFVKLREEIWARRKIWRTGELKTNVVRIHELKGVKRKKRPVSSAVVEACVSAVCWTACPIGPGWKTTCLTLNTSIFINLMSISVCSNSKARNATTTYDKCMVP